MVKEVMTPHVVSIAPEESAALAARLLARHGLGALPVCSSEPAYFKIAAMSCFSRPPFFVKNLKPLRLKGRWLAVIIMDPSHG